MATNWPMTPLGDVVTPVSRSEVVTPQATYPLLGIHGNAQGLYLQEIKSGITIRADKVYRVEQGDFVCNRRLARKGAFAIATAETHRGYVSNEFACFVVNSALLDHQYLRWYFSQASVWAEAAGRSAGGPSAGHTRLADKLLAMKIPLPAIDKQRHIVTRIAGVAAQIAAGRGVNRKIAERTALLLKSALQELFGSRAGPLKDWTPLSTLIERIETGWSPLCFPYPARPEEWGVLKTSAVSTGQFLPGENKALPSTLRPRVALEIKPGDLLFGRANTQELVGACTVVQAPPRKLLLCDKIFRFVLKDEAQIDKSFLSLALKSPPLRSQIESSASGAWQSMQSISKANVMQLRVPLPPLKEQLDIVAYLEGLQVQVEAIKRVQAKIATDLDRFLPAVLNEIFNGEL